MGSKRVNGPAFDCIHRLFEEQAASRPERTAVIHGDRSFTYGELDRRSNALARDLIDKGVQPNDVIALFADRSFEMVAGLLGILKAGASYVPLDPGYPKDRLAFLVSDSQAPLVVVPEELRSRLPALSAEILPMSREESERYPRSPVTSEDLAYVIYTSGSTGVPKGVLLPHRGLTSLMTWTRELMEIGEDDRILQFASFSFDASLWEIFAALISGAALVLGDRDSLLPGPTLHRLLKEQHVTIALLSPSVLRMLDPEGLDALRIMVAGTEKLTSDIVRRWAPGRRFFNAYGPTETTIYSTLLEVKEISDETPSIGSPVPHTEIYILDDNMRLVPAGESGELAIGGIGVARGYLKRDALTAEKFVTVDFHGGDPRRIYRTGDRARIRADGNVDYQGRTDFQVKVRGFRVELPEIEAALEKHPAVGSAAVLDGRDALGQTVLWAYFVPAPGETAAPAELRSFLGERLPDYMIPSAYTELSRWPLNPNGKLDRKALPPPAIAVDDAPDEALTKTERTLRDIVSEVLEGGRVRRDDPFAVVGLHSLALAQIVLRIESAFQVRLKYSEVFVAGTLAGLADVVERRRGQALEPAAPTKASAALHAEKPVREVPLSFAQERVWFLERLHPECRAYQFQSVFSIRGPLDVRALDRSLNEIVSRHEILRTSFPLVDGRPIQRVHAFEPFELEIEEGDLDLEREDERPFDLSSPPLVRWKLFRVREDEYRLLHREHHFLHDGWSYAVFLEELHECYRAFSNGTLPKLAPPSLQYREFASRERERFERGELAGDIEYWKTKLAGAPPPPLLPSDRPRPKSPSFRGGQIRRPVGPEAYSRLLAASAREGVTPFTWLHAVFQVFLYRYTAALDFVIGSGFANRSSADTERMLGMVINTVPVRARLDGALSFREHLKEVSRTLLEAADHESAPFEAVVRALNPDRSSGQVLFSTFVDSYDRPYPELRAPGLVVSREDGVSNGYVKFDLVVLVVPRTAAEGRVDSANLLWEYSSDLFDRETAERMLAHFWTLLEASLESPGSAISRLPMSSSEERRRIESFSVAKPSSYPRDATIPALFEAQAALRPDAVALEAENFSLNYAELNSRANRLARHLRKLGVGPEAVVGLSLERSPERIVGLLGILKAGGAYLPLDPDLPRERRDLMIRETGTRWVVERTFLEECARESEQNLEPVARPESLAYVLYTSGSTGAPKGVEVDHRAVLRLVKDPGFVELAPEETLLQLAPISFDASTFEIWGALLNGAKLAVFPSRAPSLAELGRFLEERKVTTLWLTAPLFHQMIAFELDRLSRVRQILAGGDVLDVGAVRKLLSKLPPGGRVVNGYGPTENTTFTCCHVMTSPRDLEATVPGVPIGRPIPGTRVRILDESGEPVGIGVPGELYAGGDGLARGYVGRPELTKERFVRDEDGSRFYRTGDVCRYLGDGTIEFLGRRDRQVKIRGFRVEPAEVEAVLASHPRVRETAVLAREDALVAYVVPRGDTALEVLELRSFLGETLPGYMVPASIVLLEALPLTTSGKLDRGRLPSPSSSTSPASVPPRTETEERIAAIWRDVLGLDEISVEDDFFSLGGHSLLATRIVNRLESSFGVEVPLSSLFDSGTVAGIARILEGQKASRREQGEL